MPSGKVDSENQLLDQFIHQLRVERGLSTNTIVAYSHDLIRFFDFLKQKGISLNKIGNYHHDQWQDVLFLYECFTVF
jgi:site-specific recombinase XerD